ncbi:MAG: polyprenyl synthetase family protein, partial [Kiritimatiellae bacterium]|nr:polyprenyl synthetase family protein [Kiritimatiellia bacterium]
TAVLCGDALQALAFETVAATGDIALVRELARAAGPKGVIAGQVEDIRYDGHPTRELLDHVFRHKTGDLFRCACRMGVLSARAGEEALTAITDFAEHFGLAFQIEDDLLDAVQAKEDAKPELSCLDLMSEEAARDWCRSETEAAVAALDAPGLVSEAAQNLAALTRGLVSRKV